MKPTCLVAVLCATSMICTPFSAFAWRSKACSQANGFSVLTNGTTVTAYIPNGFWEGDATGVRVVTVEGSGGAPTTVATPGVVNACAADQKLQEVVCTANDSDVYVIQGSTLVATLQSGGSGSLGFSGGYCTNCSIAVDPEKHIAYIEEAVANSPAVQAFNINNQTFQAPFPLHNGISESIQVDTVRNLLISASEDSIYDIIQLGANGAPVAEFGNGSVEAEYDASAEDCTSGLMIGSDEFSGNLFFANAKTASFDSATMTWSDAQQALLYFPEFDELAAGTTGLSVAPGKHYAVVAGEFGGNIEGFMKLPANGSTDASGFNQYVIATIPADPAGYYFANGYDPHSETAYVSPTTGKSYALFADWASGAPDYVALVDIAGMLAAPRIVSASGAKHEVDPSYDLIGNNIVKYVQTY